MKKREVKGSFYNLIKINPNQKIIKCFRLEILIIYKTDRNDGILAYELIYRFKKLRINTNILNTKLSLI